MKIAILIIGMLLGALFGFIATTLYFVETGVKAIDNLNIQNIEVNVDFNQSAFQEFLNSTIPKGNFT